MGFMWTNKNVKVNCKNNYDNGRRLTLVDNKYGEAHDFITSTDVLKYLLDEGFDGVTNYVNELVEKKFEDEQEKRKWRTYYFYVKKCNAPYIINKIDSSEHVKSKSWEIHNDGLFKEEGMVRIEYVADKQILHQDGNEVVIVL
jgi:hypothetical protein